MRPLLSLITQRTRPEDELSCPIDGCPFRSLAHGSTARRRAVKRHLVRGHHLSPGGAGA